MADLEAKAETTHRTLILLETSNMLMTKNEVERRDVLDKFHKAYMALASDIPESSRKFIDSNLASMSKQGFRQMELEQDAVAREKEAAKRGLDKNLTLTSPRGEVEWRGRSA